MDFDLEFPSRKSSVQFNHAAVCPLPARAADAIRAYADNLSLRGALDWKDWIRKADEVRSLAARLIGCDERAGGAASISIVPNTTWGLNLVASGFPFRPGDSVVTTASEFPANLAPWVALAAKGVTIRRVPTRDGAFAAADVEAACDATTRLVSVSLVAFHTGFRAPAEELAAFCRARGIVFGLDGIQAVGAQRVDVAGWGVDFLSADGHKWMLGPEGAGILFTTPALRARLEPPPGWTNLDRASPTDYRVPESLRFRADGARFEPGALPTPGLYALAASLGLLLEIGLPEVEARIDTDARRPRRGPSAAGLLARPLRRAAALGDPRGPASGWEGRALLPEAGCRGECRDLGARGLRPLLAARRQRRVGGGAGAGAAEEALASDPCAACKRPSSGRRSADSLRG